MYKTAFIIFHIFSIQQSYFSIYCFFLLLQFILKILYIFNIPNIWYHTFYFYFRMKYRNIWYFLFKKILITQNNSVSLHDFSSFFQFLFVYYAFFVSLFLLHLCVLLKLYIIFFTYLNISCVCVCLYKKEILLYIETWDTCFDIRDIYIFMNEIYETFFAKNLSAKWNWLRMCNKSYINNSVNVYICSNIAFFFNFIQ